MCMSWAWTFRRDIWNRLGYSKDNSGTFWRYIANEYFLAIYYCTGEMDKLWRIETSCYVTNATFCDRRICDEMRRRRTSQIIVAFGHFCDHLWLRQFKSFWPVLFLVVFDFALSTQSQWKILKKLYQHAAISMSHTRRHCDRRIVDGDRMFQQLIILIQLSQQHNADTSTLFISLKNFNYEVLFANNFSSKVY